LLWDIEVGAVLRAMQKHTAAIYCCQFSPNDSYIASGSFDRTIKLWLGETGEEVAAGTMDNSAAEPLLSAPSSSSEAHRSTAAAARTTVRHGTYKPQDENSRENHHTDRMAVCAFTSQVNIFFMIEYLTVLIIILINIYNCVCVSRLHPRLFARSAILRRLAGWTQR